LKLRTRPSDRRLRENPGDVALVEAELRENSWSTDWGSVDRSGAWSSVPGRGNRAYRTKPVTRPDSSSIRAERVKSRSAVRFDLGLELDPGGRVKEHPS